MIKTWASVSHEELENKQGNPFLLSGAFDMIISSMHKLNFSDKPESSFMWNEIVSYSSK